eukprot:tig00021179_g19277.t1
MDLREALLLVRAGQLAPDDASPAQTPGSSMRRRKSMARKSVFFSEDGEAAGSRRESLQLRRDSEGRGSSAAPGEAVGSRRASTEAGGDAVPPSRRRVSIAPPPDDAAGASGRRKISLTMNAEGEGGLREAAEAAAAGEQAAHERAGAPGKRRVSIMPPGEGATSQRRMSVKLPPPPADDDGPNITVAPPSFGGPNRRRSIQQFLQPLQPPPRPAEEETAAKKAWSKAGVKLSLATKLMLVAKKRGEEDEDEIARKARYEQIKKGMKLDLLPEVREQLAEECIVALKKEADERSDSDLRSLFTLLSTLRFFDQLPSALRLELCSAVAWCSFVPEEQLFEQGDDSRSAYVILTGRVEVAGEGKAAVELGPFGVLGEANLERQRLRSATATALDEVDCLVLEKSDYDRALRTWREREALGTAMILKAFAPLQKKTTAELVRIGYFAQRRAFRPGTVIAREGEAAPTFAFVRSGVIRLVTDVALFDDAAAGRDAAVSGWRTVEVGLVAAGGHIGCDEAFDDCPGRGRRLYTYVAAEPCELLFFHPKDAIRTFGHEALKQMKEGARLAHEWRNERVEILGRPRVPALAGLTRASPFAAAAAAAAAPKAPPSPRAARTPETARPQSSHTPRDRRLRRFLDKVAPKVPPLAPPRPWGVPRPFPPRVAYPASARGTRDSGAKPQAQRAPQPPPRTKAAPQAPRISVEARDSGFASLQPPGLS